MKNAQQILHTHTSFGAKYTVAGGSEPLIFDSEEHIYHAMEEIL